MEKIVLVTGASKGFGRAIAKAFIDRGAKVIAVARNLANLESLDDYAKSKGNDIVMVPLDLTEYNKIDELGYNIFKRFGKLDILVSVAAVFGVLSPVAHISPDVWRKVMSLNLEANWRLIRSFDSLLKASGNPAEAVFVSAPCALETNAYYGAYAVSKAGLEALVGVYAKELATSSVKVSVFTPPPMTTDMRKQEYPGLDNENIASADEVAESLVKSLLCETVA